mgnify:CR=1 FL=1
MNSIDELVRLQADMDEVFSAIVDKSKKTFIEHIDAGLAFKFKRRPDNGDLIFSVQGDYELLDDYIFTNCRES